MRTSANLLSLTHLFPTLGGGPAYFARQLLTTPNASVTGGFDEAVVALLRWTPTGSAASLAALPHTAIYAAKQVAVARSGWGAHDSYLGVKGGNSAMTHQDLDHGSFVFETSGQRWVCDLGIENYLLAGMFGSSARYTRSNFSLDRQWGSRYAYYRKSTRGHNTLTFDERGGFDPTDAAVSDQAVNIVSPLILPPPREPSTADAQAAEAAFVAVNLTEAYSRRLAAGGSVVRSFGLDAAMKCLSITDTIHGLSHSASNVSFTIHTRARVTISSSGATLHMNGKALQFRTAVRHPLLQCGVWRADAVVLPTDQAPAAERFPVRGAVRVWLTCETALNSSFALTTTLCEV